MTTTDERLTALEQRLADVENGKIKLGITKADLVAAVNVDTAVFDEGVRADRARYRARQIALIDERIELALDRARRDSLDSYRKGRDGLPKTSSIPGGDVDRVVDGADGRLVSPESSNQVDQFTHGLAPSRSGEGSVGAAPASGPSSDAGDDTTGDQR